MGVTKDLWHKMDLQPFFIYPEKEWKFRKNNRHYVKKHNFIKASKALHARTCQYMRNKNI